MTENTPENRALLKIAAIRHSWDLYEAAAEVAAWYQGRNEEFATAARALRFHEGTPAARCMVEGALLGRRLKEIVRQIREEAK